MNNRDNLIKALRSLRSCPNMIRYPIIETIISFIETDELNHNVSLSDKVIGAITYTKPNGNYLNPKHKLRTSLPRYIRRQMNIDPYMLSDATLDQINKAFIYEITTEFKLIDFFKIIKGSDVKFYYTNIASHSCMTGNKSSFIDIYAANPDKVSLVTAKDYSRALLWTCDDGTIVLDRVYPSGSKSVNIIRKWAAEKGYVLRDNPDRVIKTFNNISLSDGKQHFVTMKKTLHFPYTDTFCYGTHLNNQEILLTNFQKNNSFVLHSPYGVYLNITKCKNCASTLLESNCHLYNDDIYCEPCWKLQFFNCYRCARFFLKESRHFLSGSFYCEECFKKHGITCAYCNKIGLNSDRKTKERKDICISCSQRYFEYCDFCGFFDIKTNIITKSGYHCKDCFAKVFATCLHCKKVYKKNYKDVDRASAIYCDKCLQKAVKCFVCNEFVFTKPLIYLSNKTTVYTCPSCKDSVEFTKCKICNSFMLLPTDEICYKCTNLNKPPIIPAVWQKYSFKKITTVDNYYLIADTNTKYKKI